MLKKVIIFSIYIFLNGNILGQGANDTISLFGTFIEEHPHYNYMLNNYKVNDNIYMDKGFYLYNENRILYSRGFYCIETLNILDSEGIVEGQDYMLKFWSLKENQAIISEKEVKSYTNLKNRTNLLKKLNSKKVRKINFPVTYAFHPERISEEQLKLYFEKYENVYIKAIRKKEFDFKRYIFNGKNLKLIKIPFYYIIEFKVGSLIIR